MKYSELKRFKHCHTLGIRLRVDSQSLTRVGFGPGPGHLYPTKKNFQVFLSPRQTSNAFQLSKPGGTVDYMQVTLSITHRLHE